MSQLKAIFDRVLHLLEKDSKYRDNDQLLVARIWWEELQAKGINSDDITATQFMAMYRDEKLTSSDSITRCRRKINEELSHTIGKSYKPRQRKQFEVKHELKEIAGQVQNKYYPTLFK